MAPARHVFVPSRLVPERKFYPVPHPEFVVDHAQMVFDHVLCRTNDFGYLAVLKTLRDEFNDLPLAWAGDSGSIETAGWHGRTGFRELHSELQFSHVRPHVGFRINARAVPPAE